MYIFDNGLGHYLAIRILIQYEVFGPNGSDIYQSDKPLIEIYDAVIRDETNPVGVAGSLIHSISFDKFHDYYHLEFDHGSCVEDFLIEIPGHSDNRSVEIMRDVYDTVLGYIFSEIVHTPENLRSDYVAECLNMSQKLKVDPKELILGVHRILKKREQNQVLSLDPGQDGTDYTLKQPECSVWITVDGFSVYVKREDEGVVVDIFGKGHEDKSIASAYAHLNILEESDS